MDAWAAQRGHQPPLDETVGKGTLGHMIADDPVCVPVLMLLFGQRYATDGAADGETEELMTTKPWRKGINTLLWATSDDRANQAWKLA